MRFGLPAGVRRAGTASLTSAFSCSSTSPGIPTARPWTWVAAVTFDQLKAWIGKVDADVRLLVIDSCKSGSLLQSKGGTRVRPFEIQMNDDLPISAKQLITSSAANESALESEEIRGSFFTHYFVSGLRGAADTSGDGQVSLAEAYKYAFVQTESATAATLGGIQHPSYDYRLSGQGELILTSLSGNSATLTLPADSTGSHQQSAPRRDRRRADPASRRRRWRCVPVATASVPGEWPTLRRWCPSRRSGAERAPHARTSSTSSTDLAVTAKGGPTSPIARGRWNTFVALGWTRGVAQDLGAASTAARVGLRSAKARGFTLNVDGAIGETAGLHRIPSRCVGRLRRSG